MSTVKSMNLVLATMLEVIPEKGIPSGPLYAALMGRVTLAQYTSVISALKSVDAITEKGHYLERGPRYEHALKVFRA